MKVPGLSNTQTTDLLHVAGWAGIVAGLVHCHFGWTPPTGYFELCGIGVAGGVANGRFCPDEHP